MVKERREREFEKKRTPLELRAEFGVLTKIQNKNLGDFEDFMTRKERGPLAWRKFLPGPLLARNCSPGSLGVSIVDSGNIFPSV